MNKNYFFSILFEYDRVAKAHQPSKYNAIVRQRLFDIEFKTPRRYRKYIALSFKER